MQTERKPGRGLVVALLAGASLWTLAAVRHSLWIDEFHSLHHAVKPDFGAFLDSLATGNHPPLSFLLLRWSRALVGETELAMRAWSILVGLGVLVLGTRVARRLPDDAARRVAPWLIVASSFSLMIFSEVRMYGLLALAVLGMLETIATTLEGKSRGWWLVLWIPLGLHAHYYALHYGFVLAVALLVGIALRPQWRAGFVRLIPPALVGLALFLPWGLTGFRQQLGHDMPSGGTAGLYANWKGFAQSLAHLLFIHASVDGKWLTYGVALPGSAIGAILGALGLARLWRARDRDGGLLLWMLVTVGLAAPAWCLVVSMIVPRAGYNWRYIAGSLVPVLLIVAAGVRRAPAWRAGLSALLLACMGTVTLVTAVAPGTEDYRGVVRYILEHAEPGDAILTHPTRYVDTENAWTGWEYYLDRLGGASSYPNVPVEHRVPRWQPCLQSERVWLFVRYRFPDEILERLEQEFDSHEVVPIGTVLTVHLFSRASSAEGGRAGD